MSNDKIADIHDDLLKHFDPDNPHHVAAMEAADKKAAEARKAMLAAHSVVVHGKELPGLDNVEKAVSNSKKSRGKSSSETSAKPKRKKRETVADKEARILSKFADRPVTPASRETSGMTADEVLGGIRHAVSGLTMDRHHKWQSYKDERKRSVKHRRNASNDLGLAIAKVRNEDRQSKGLEILKKVLMENGWAKLGLNSKPADPAWSPEAPMSAKERKAKKAAEAAEQNRKDQEELDRQAEYKKRFDLKKVGANIGFKK